MSGMFSLLKSEIKVQELQKKTGKSYNECSSALHLADGAGNQAGNSGLFDGYIWDR